MKKIAMAATYTEVSLEDIEKFLRRSFRVLRPHQGVTRGEIHYDMELGRFVGIRVWTSVARGRESGAGVGADAIRVGLISLKDKGPLEKGKLPIVKRTQNWRDSLKDRIEDAVEKYEEKDEFWEQWAETRQRSGGPEKAIRQEERREQVEDRDRSEEESARDEDGEGDEAPREAPRPPRRSDYGATWAKLKDGSWGIATQDPDAEPGDMVQVRRQDGKVAPVTLGKFVWEGYGKKLFEKAEASRRYAGDAEGDPEFDQILRALGGR
jgi:hypothetical protein